MPILSFLILMCARGLHSARFRLSEVLREADQTHSVATFPETGSLQMLTPLLQDEDEFSFDVLGVRISPTTGLLGDPSPPFMLYRSNPNQEQNGVNSYATEAYEDRWYPLPTAMRPISSKSKSTDMCVAQIQTTCARQ
jgi:hypothetical protein